MPDSENSWKTCSFTAKMLTEKCNSMSEAWIFQKVYILWQKMLCQVKCHDFVKLNSHNKCHNFITKVFIIKLQLNLAKLCNKNVFLDKNLLLYCTFTSVAR